MTNLLVPIDFSDVTTAVISEAKQLASGLTSPHVWLVHVAPPDLDFVGYEVGPQHVRDWQAEDLREEHRQLQFLSAELREEGIETTALLIEGPAVEAILKQSNKLSPRYIVMGSHGHGGIYKMVMGSVSEGVLKQVKSPVLFVPANQS